MLTVQADLAGGAYETTQYVYGVTTAGGSAINSQRHAGRRRVPRPEHRQPPAPAQQETYTVNALGQSVTCTDRNGTVHTYSYDVLGRQTADAVTTLGSGVDGAVRRIETAYDTQGNPYLFTSYDAASGGSVVNQVQDVLQRPGPADRRVPVPQRGGEHRARRRRCSTPTPRWPAGPTTAG